MKHTVTQIALLLILFVGIKAGSEKETCPPKSIKPIKFPPDYLLGVWRPTLCINSLLCSKDDNCIEYPYRKEKKDVYLYIYGYDKSGELVKDSAKVEYLDQPGLYKSGPLFDVQYPEYYMLYTSDHFLVLYGCLTDKKNVTHHAGWISTKDDPKNKLEPEEMKIAEEVLKKNGILLENFYQPSHKNCEKIDKLAEDADLHKH